MRGIGDSLYTPFCGTDGDDIDWDAYRTLVRYCVGDLGHPMLWCTSGIAEFWSLTLDERKRLLEVAIEEARGLNPHVVIQACTAATSAKDCLDLTLHAQEAGADIAYIQTPMMEAHGGEGVLRFFKYVAARTDIALGMFNSPSSGYVLTPAESARIYDEVPAVCATKEGAFRPEASRRLHELAPALAVWECDRTVYRAGWLRAGIVCPAQLGRPATCSRRRSVGCSPNTGSLCSTTNCLRRWITGVSPAWTNSTWISDRGGPAIPGGRTTSPTGAVRSNTRRRCWGCPSATIPHSRPPQAELPPEAKAQIEDAYRRLGLVSA